MNASYFRILYRLMALTALGVLALYPLLVWSAPMRESWKLYRSNALAVELKIPTSWTLVERQNALTLISPRQGQKTATFALIKNNSNETFTEAAIHVILGYRPLDWVSSQSFIGGQPCTKIVGTDKQDPSKHLIQYFVSAREGYVVIYLLAPKQSWASYSSVYNTLLQNIHFLR